MKFNLSNNVLSFTLIIFSLVVLFDVLFKQKKSNRLKISLTFLCIPILIHNILIYFNISHFGFFDVFLLMKILFILSVLQLFSNLYFSNHKKYVNILSFVFLILYFIRLIYSLIYHINYSITIENYYPLEITPLGSINKFSYKFVLIRLGTTLIFISYFIYFWIQFVYKFNLQNIYQKKIKFFTNAIALLLLIALTLFIIKYIFHYNISKSNNIIISFLFQLYVLIVLLNRPYFLNRVNDQKMAIINRMNYSNEIELDIRLFDELFFNKLIYIKKDINIKLFSEQLGVDKDNLSVYIYNRFGFGFDDLVNKHRVAYFTELIKNPKYNNLTIDALAKEVGFASRSAFYKPFKKFHGGNPSDLIDMYS